MRTTVNNQKSFRLLLAHATFIAIVGSWSKIVQTRLYLISNRSLVDVHTINLFLVWVDQLAKGFFQFSSRFTWIDLEVSASRKSKLI